MEEDSWMESSARDQTQWLFIAKIFCESDVLLYTAALSS